MGINYWRNVYFESACYRTEQYNAFEKTAINSIKRQCKKYGISVHKVHPNHFAFSVVLERGGKFVYVSVGDVRFNNWFNTVIIRTMAHDKDWSGGTNNYCPFNKIGEKADTLFKLA